MTVIFREEVVRKIRSAVGLLADAVGQTLGTKGGNALLTSSYTNPTITNDGITIAKAIELDDELEDAIIKVVRESSAKTNDQAGDGTTTSIVLARALIDLALDRIASGENPQDLKREILKGSKEIVEEIKKLSKPADSKEIEMVATISSSDPEVGKLVAEVYSKIGKDGIVSVERSASGETYYEVVDGVELNTGIISPHLITDHEKERTVLVDPAIITYDGNMDGDTMSNIIKDLAENGKRQALVIANNFHEDAIALSIINHTRGVVTCIPVRNPFIGTGAKEGLDDLSAIVGTETVLEGKYSAPSTYGTAKSIVLKKKTTTIIEGNTNKVAIKEIIASIKYALGNKEIKEFDKTQLTTRLANLSGGVAVIRVGAPSEVELKEKLHRVEDAKEAVKAAIEEGVVTGGGIALLNIGHTRSDIFSKALLSPIKQLIVNTGEKASNVIIGEILEKKDPSFGYNSTTQEIENLTEAGILDPVKVTRLAVENASSVAAVLITANVMISPKKVKDEKEDDI